MGGGGGGANVRGRGYICPYTRVFICSYTDLSIHDLIPAEPAVRQTANPGVVSSSPRPAT